MRAILWTVFILAGVCASAFAQSPEKSLSQFSPDKTEPFKLASGSSFYASTSSEKRTAAVPNSKLNEEIISDDFREALDIIRQNQVSGDRLSLDDLTKSALQTMLHSLDPHSNYYNAENFRELLSDEQSEYSGIGASIANFTKNGVTDTFVTATFEASPANRAGLRFGDKIVSVNGENMTGKSSAYVRDKIRGIKNSTAQLTVERSANGRIEPLEIRRATVPQPSIPDAYILRPGVGYVDLTNGFNYTTSGEFDDALKNLHQQGMNSLILDLRDNPGGIVEQAVKVAEKFLASGQTILTQRGRTAFDDRNWKSFNKMPESVSLVLLVNGGSASASEIVTGALQDDDRAIIVGEKTFGKGLVQSVLDLPGGSGLTLTTAKYYTPSGRSIQRDYSRGNLYDYYRRRTAEVSGKQSPSKTLTGRDVFGGDGISPDENIAAAPLTSTEVSLLDPLFFFVRELANGKIEELANYKINAPVQYGKRIGATDFPVDEKVLNALRNYLNREKISFSDKQFANSRKFIVSRIRFNLMTAAYGSVTANQVLIENDLQIARAVESLPRAKNLALIAQRISRKK